jgi:hypothetical protein
MDSWDFSIAACPNLSGMIYYALGVGDIHPGACVEQEARACEASLLDI